MRRLVDGGVERFTVFIAVKADLQLGSVAEDIKRCAASVAGEVEKACHKLDKVLF